LSQAYNDYFGAVADFNRSQFRLYRALGNSNTPLSTPSIPMPQEGPAPPLCQVASGLAICNPPAPPAPPDEKAVLLSPTATPP